MTVLVAWLPLGPGGPPSRGSQWDEALLDAALTGALWRAAGAPRYAHQDGLQGCDGGAVVIVPARYWAAHPDALTGLLADLAWCVVVLASDEESSFPWRALSHPRMRLWVMTPRPGVHPPVGADGGPVRYLGEGWPHRTPQTLAWYFAGEAAGRPLDWFFAGQVTHQRRQACADQLRSSRGGRLVETASFAAGIAHKEYLGGLASAKVAPCPSGPVTPDSFRVYEALEAGCVPVADGYCPGYPDGGYWPLLLGEDPPWPVVDDWAEWPGVLDGVLGGWSDRAARCSAWWQAHKRDLVYAAAADIAALSDQPPPVACVADLVTVVVTVSPTPDHPSTDMLADTLASVRAHPDLAACDTIVACDGVRPGMEHRAEAYAEHLRAVCWRCEHEWPQTVPVLADGWQHQAGTVAAALAAVRTPLVLLVEHDTPLCGPVPWPEVCAALLAGRCDLVRLYHEAAVHPDHAHLMLDSSPADFGGFPGLRTIQWSNRPHVATVGYYRRILADHFAGRRSFVEDTMHGVVQHSYADTGDWSRHALVLYAPDGDMKRSLHSDGRGGDPKAPGWVVG